MTQKLEDTQEHKRLQEKRSEKQAWRRWGPYLSERQWGTVREDYSENADAWAHFTHEQSRSRAYRWGEDGLGGISDNKQLLCFALALWNEKDPLLKERAFGLTNAEGNHGEDCKEYYYYLDSTPTHSYMKYLYRYPQREYPYRQLVDGNRRSREEPEYELLDTGIFDDNRYFDVYLEYAKAAPEDILIRITVENRGPDGAALHVLPTLWFRNTWSWESGAKRPLLKAADGAGVIKATHPELGKYVLTCEGAAELLFTENETNQELLFQRPNRTPYVKDGINNYIVSGQAHTVNPRRSGTKAAAHYRMQLAPGAKQILRLRLAAAAGKSAEGAPPLAADQFDQLFAVRLGEADAFYDAVTPDVLSADAALVMRQAWAGLLWTKQFYYFDLDKWLEEHKAHPLQGQSRPMRNREWFHMVNADVISMPDKWEYPWYAAWDLAFHTIPLGAVDPAFARAQLELMLNETYLHPNGQIPAYEWNFSDVNPPVHPWAALYLYFSERQSDPKTSRDFLRRVFSKLLINFTWWVNRKDRSGKNVFEGGFLGLDNIGVFDRSSALPTGGYLEQADGTSWMAFYCLCMAEMAIELAADDPATYEPLVVKYAEHFFWISSAVNGRNGGRGLWDEEDGFYYDHLCLLDGSSIPLKVRSLVGLLPMCAVVIIEPKQRERIPNALKRLQERLERMPELRDVLSFAGLGVRGVEDRGLFGLVNQERLVRILGRMLDEAEFLSPYGIRSLSKYHLEHPYVFKVGEQEYRVEYVPGDSNSGMFGGNSNWRGPIWLPMNVMIVRALVQYYLFCGDSLRVECPTGSGVRMNLFEVAGEISRRLSSIFLVNQEGRRPSHGLHPKFAADQSWRDAVLFYEYFHGDTGAGVGATHQTGWTGLIARLMQLFASGDAEKFLAGGKAAAASYRE
jgi:hypothetical protein